MFLGQHQLTLDIKNRLQIPSRFRELLARGAFITQGFDQNLLLLTPEAFQDIFRKVQSTNIADPQARLMRRMILGTAAELEPDENGWVTIPPELKEFAGLGEAVVLVGQGDYFEAWTPDSWKVQQTRLQDAEANGSRFAELIMTSH